MFGIAWKCNFLENYDKPTNHETDLGVHKEVILLTIVLDNYRTESHSGCNILCRSIEQRILNTLYLFGLIQTGSLFQLRNPMENFTYATVKGSSVDMYFRRQVHTGCSGKIVFCHNSLQPLSHLHHCKRHSKFSTQCENTVTPIGW